MDGIKGSELTELVARRLREHSSSVKSIPTLADFCHVTATTAAGWMGSSKPLGGLPTLHLWHFLDALKIDQPELRKLRRDYPFGAYVGELLAYGVVSMEEARGFGISTRKEGDDALLGEGAIFRAARGEGRISKERFTYDELIANYGDELQEAKKRLQEKVAGWNELLAPSSPSVTSSTPEETPTSTRIEALFEELIGRITASEKPRIVEIAEMAEVLLNALGVANRALYGLTPAERSKLREMMGEGGMFALSNAVAMLCSERARGKGIDK